MSFICTCTSLVCHSCLLVCHPYNTRMYSHVIRVHSYVTCMSYSLVFTCMSSVCHSYILVCHSYVILVCHLYVIVCHLSVIRMYWYVTSKYSYVICMSLVYSFTMSQIKCRLTRKCFLLASLELIHVKSSMLKVYANINEVQPAV